MAYATENTTFWVNHPVTAVDTEYRMAVILGGYDSGGVPYKTGDTVANFKYGASFFYHDGSNWNLTYRFPADDIDAVYFVASLFTGSRTVYLDDIKVPDPASHTEEGLLGGDPLLSLHTFSSGSADKGGAFTGATWSIAAGAITNTPTLGAELLTNGNFANWTADDPDNWTVGGESGSDPEVCEVATGEAHVNCGTPGGGFANLYNSASGYNPYIQQAAIQTVDNWYQWSIELNTVTAGDLYFSYLGAGNESWTAPASIVATGRANNVLVRAQPKSAGSDITIDDFSVKKITTSTLFYTMGSGDDDVFVTTEATIADDKQGGLVVALDSAATPANFILAWYDRVNIDSNDVRMYKYVGGDSNGTSIVSDTAETYSAGAPITVIKDGSTAYIFYNNKLIGSGDVSDAGLVNNTIHGLFSTHSSNSFDNLVIQALGSDGEYANLNNY
jgi:hypothetical protein